MFQGGPKTAQIKIFIKLKPLREEFSLLCFFEDMGLSNNFKFIVQFVRNVTIT